MTKLTEENLNTVKEALVLVHSSFCPECATVLNDFDFLSNNINIYLMTLEFDTQIDLCDNILKVEKVPSYLYIKNGKLQSIMSGVQNTKTINVFVKGNRN